MTKRAFLIADKILRGPALAMLQASYALRSDVQGVAAFDRDDSVVVVVDPDSFSLARLSDAVRDAMRGAAELKIVAPSAIQYFASKMQKTDPIFAAINSLAKFAVAVQDAPVFRVIDETKGADAQYKHQLTFSSFPSDFAKVRCDYVGADGAIVGLDAVGVPGETRPVAVPLIFYHSGLADQHFEPGSLIVHENVGFDFERLAFDQLMLRFPSRSAGADEIADLAQRFGLSVEQVQAAWKHNREQWDAVRYKLGVLGCIMPGPVARGTDQAFDQFSHLILSGALKLVSRIDAAVPRIRHIGLPIFARNGVSIPLGPEGIVVDKQEFSNQSIVDRIEMLLPQALAATFDLDTSANARTPVVTDSE
ncbi:hypothetical protein [Devosia sediminis]|uniref:Uncharacterized protein n=1 Tax=Devosia sediminis TaxID=2798801 RepID=A0A934ITB5_9HYPH|nr:hypothetical protein [Devosia sediminis]MBJ3786398.1 hypothetical protein [Devosia sediminis]